MRLLMLLIAALLAAPAAAVDEHELDAYVEDVMRQWTVPGLAIAVVRGEMRDMRLVPLDCPTLSAGHGPPKAGRFGCRICWW